MIDTARIFYMNLRVGGNVAVVSVAVAGASLGGVSVVAAHYSVLLATGVGWGGSS